MLDKKCLILCSLLILQPYTGPIVKLPELPASRSHVNENYVLKNVNKLRECWFKYLNTVVFDDQVSFFSVVNHLFFNNSLFH